MDHRMKEKLEALYFQMTDLWKQFCEEHNELFNLTCDEYSLLLRSELELLEEKIEEKNKCIQKIGVLEMLRRELVADLANLVGIFCRAGQPDRLPRAGPLLGRALVRRQGVALFGRHGQGDFFAPLRP